MTGLIYATTQFWGEAPRYQSEEKTRTVNNLVRELSEKEAACFDCPLYLEDGADCNQIDPRCPFYRSHHKQQAMAKASYRLRNKWQRELDEAVERIVAEREVPCAT